MKISFSPPDITEKEILNVIESLKSGWITTGPKTKLFEKKIAEYCNNNKAVCLNSATACLEMTLRLLNIGPGDEVIVPAYTYTASCSPIYHVGAKPVMVDIQKDNLEMDYNQLENLINENTKVIIPVDIAGILCDYEKIFEIVNRKRNIFKPKGEIQEKFNRIIVVADSAHGFGARKNNKKSGELADFTTFSFHAVKNLTTAEGGAVTWKNNELLDDEEIYKKYQILSLHGQTKDALAKTKLGAWEYDIVSPAYKCNMTDIQASIGLTQLERYDDLLNARYNIIKKYNSAFKNLNLQVLPHLSNNNISSGHLYIVNINGIDELKRNNIITQMAEKGIATNVHYKPLPLLTAYKNLGFKIEDFPNSYNYYKNEITLPLYSKLKDEEVEFIINEFINILRKEKCI